MFRALWLEIKRFFEALAGKISFDAWARTINDFAKEIILEHEKGGETYDSGACIVRYQRGQVVSAQVRLLFRCPDGSQNEVTAERTFPEKQFLSESLNYMAARGEIDIPITLSNS